MKKVFMILIAAVLLLSMAGVVSAEEITNISVRDNVTTLVTLDLSNDYKVTIPATASIHKVTKDGKVVYSGYMQIGVSVTLLSPGKNLYVNVTSLNYGPDSIKYNWTLSNSTSSDNLTYYMKVSDYYESDHIEDNHIANPGSAGLLKYGEGIVTNVGVTKYIHMRVVDTPSKTGTYADRLKFTVSIP